jgi:hypothetical protein
MCEFERSQRTVRSRRLSPEGRAKKCTFVASPE